MACANEITGSMLAVTVVFTFVVTSITVGALTFVAMRIATRRRLQREIAAINESYNMKPQKPVAKYQAPEFSMPVYSKQSISIDPLSTYEPPQAPRNAPPPVPAQVIYHHDDMPPHFKSDWSERSDSTIAPLSNAGPLSRSGTTRSQHHRREPEPSALQKYTGWAAVKKYGRTVSNASFWG